MSDTFYAFGDEAYEEEKKRQEKLAKEREAARVASIKAFPLWMSENEVKNVVFLHTRPLIYHAHDVKYAKKFGDKVKETYGSLPCMIKATGKCPKCEEQESPKAKVLYVVFDITPYEKDGVTYEGGNIKPLIRPFSDASKIKRLFDGQYYESGEPVTEDVVSKKVMKINRDGSGTATTYSFYPNFAVKLTAEQEKRINEFKTKYPNPTEYAVKWIEHHYTEMMQDLNYVQKPQVVSEEEANAVVDSNDLPF